MTLFVNLHPLHSVHPLPLSAGGGVESPTKYSKRGGGLVESQFLEGVAGKEGDDFFQGKGCSFYIKNKLKSEIFNNKKSL